MNRNHTSQGLGTSRARILTDQTTKQSLPPYLVTLLDRFFEAYDPQANISHINGLVDDWLSLFQMVQVADYGNSMEGFAYSPLHLSNRIYHAHRISEFMVHLESWYRSLEVSVPKED